MTRRPRPSLLHVALGVVLMAAAAASAQINPADLIGEGPKPFVEPEGFYRVVLPSGFDCNAKTKRRVICKGKRGTNALLQLDVLDVPTSATAKLHWLNQMERFKKKPHFEQLSKEEMTIGNVQGVKVAFKYDYLGNVNYKVGVVAAYFKQENKLYSIHFESNLLAYNKYQPDLKTLFETFRLTPLDPGGNPILDDVKLENEEEVGIPRYLKKGHHPPVGY
jgi:hypothetical protein